MQANTNRAPRRILLLLTVAAGVLVAALLLFACGDESKKAPDVPAQQTEAPDPGAALTAKLSDYTIVRGDRSGNPILKQALNLRSAVRTKSKIDLPLGTDFTPDEGKPEILIGMTNRQASIDVAMELTESTRYILRAMGNKIVILANTQKGLAEAVDYLTSEYLSGAAKATKVAQIDHTEFSDDVLLMNKDQHFQFVLPNDADPEFADCASAIIESFHVPEFALVRQSRFSAEHAVYLGAVAEDPVSMSYADIINENEYFARVAANNVYLQGKDDLLTLISLGEFLQHVVRNLDYDFEGNLCISLPVGFYITQTWEFSVPHLPSCHLDNSESISSNAHIFYYSEVSDESLVIFKQQLEYLGFTHEPTDVNIYSTDTAVVYLDYLASNKTLSITLITNGEDAVEIP